MPSLHTAALAFADYVRERRAPARQVRDDVQPRIPRPRMYALMRAWATVVQRDLQVSAVVGDMMAGRPVVYSTFLAYDEVAHHSGIERHDTLAVLRQVDRQIARVQIGDPGRAAALRARRPVRPRAVAGRDVRRPLRRDARGPRPRGVRCRHLEAHAGGEDEALAYLGAGLTEVADDDTTAGRAVASATRERRAGGAVTLDAGRAGRDRAGRRAARDRGDGLGLPGARQLPARARARDAGAARRAAPAAVPALREHPGIGFVVVRSEEHGAVVLGARGTPLPRRGARRGRGPAGAVRPQRRRRTCAAPTASRTAPTCSSTPPSRPTPRRSPPSRSSSARTAGWAAASRSRSSSSRARCPIPDQEVVGAEHLHRVLRRWLAELGHDAYRDEAPVTAAGGGGSPPASR